MSATSDVSPVRVFNAPTRRAVSSSVACGPLVEPEGATASLYSHRPPGAVNLDVTQTNISQTICQAHWTKTIRPSTHYTNTLKQQQMLADGDTVSDPDVRCMLHSDNPRCYEEDHLISLELGGAPRDPGNLWPEPYRFGARRKDWVENFLNRQVCNGAMTLQEAQQAVVNNWPAVYRAFHRVSL